MLFPARPCCEVVCAMPSSSFFATLDASGSGEPQAGQNLNVGSKAMYPHLGHFIVSESHWRIFVIKSPNTRFLAEKNITRP